MFLLILLLCFSLICFVLLLSHRSNLVYKECDRVLKVIGILARKDINLGLDWEWRYDEFEAISYDKMWLQFWKPIGSFFAFSKCYQDKV